MKVAAYEGSVENGCVRLPTDVVLHEKTIVYVVVPNIIDVETPQAPRVCSPRLANPAQAADFFKMVVTDEDTDAK